jgi:hypothetical protein
VRAIRFANYTKYYIERAFGFDFNNEKSRLRKELEFEKVVNFGLKQQLNDLGHLELRSQRLHPFIKESLQIAVSYLDGDKSINFEVRNESLKLEGLFTKFGSDKETRHSYSKIYSTLLNGIRKPRILEIGIGSINDFPYAGLAPGGSLKAWREGYPDALIVGADIDPKSVSEVTETAFVLDQTSDESLDNFLKSIEMFQPFDLIVDDGFHDPHANLRTFLKLIPCLSKKGCYVVEDVHESLIDFWKVISCSLRINLRVLDLRSERPGVDDNILLIFSK